MHLNAILHTCNYNVSGNCLTYCFISIKGNSRKIGKHTWEKIFRKSTHDQSYYSQKSLWARLSRGKNPGGYWMLWYWSHKMRFDRPGLFTIWALHHARQCATIVDDPKNRLLDCFCPVGHVTRLIISWCRHTDAHFHVVVVTLAWFPVENHVYRWKPCIWQEERDSLDRDLSLARECLRLTILRRRNDRYRQRNGNCAHVVDALHVGSNLHNHKNTWYVCIQAISCIQRHLCHSLAGPRPETSKPSGAQNTSLPDAIRTMQSAFHKPKLV